MKSNFLESPLSMGNSEAYVPKRGAAINMALDTNNLLALLFAMNAEANNPPVLWVTKMTLSLMVFPNVPFKFFDAVVQILQPVVWKEPHIILIDKFSP